MQSIVLSRCFRLLLLCSALAFPFITSAQKPSATPATPDDILRTTTELVQTDVMVFDRRGKFVDSISAEQLKLSVDGQPRPISLLSRMTAGNRVEDQRAPSASSANTANIGPASPAASGRLIFFFLDDLHLSPEALSRGRKALLRFVDQEMALDDQVAVVSTSGQIGFLQQLSDSRSVLHAAINRLGDRRSREGYVGRTQITEYMATRIQDSRDSKLFTYLMESVKVEYALGAGARRGAHNNDSAGQSYRILKNRIGSIAAQSRANTTATLDTLRSLMDSSAKLPGRKLVFLMSDGFIVDPRGSDTFDLLREVTQAAAQAGAVIYAMDTRGTFMNASVDASWGGYVNMTSRDGGVSLGETTAPRQPLSVLAEETGGRAIFNSNSIEDAIGQAVRETSDYYVLAWRPETENERTGKARLEIVIDGRPDLRVRLRRNYVKTLTPAKIKTSSAKDASPSTTTPEAQLLTALGSAYAIRSLPTFLSVGFTRNTQSASVLTASMQIDRAALGLDSSSGGKTEVDVIGAAVDDRGLIYTFKQILTVIPQVGPEPVPVIWNQQLNVQPGLYQVRVAVRDRRTGLSGSAMQWIEVPAVERDRFIMSSLFLGERHAGNPSEQSRGPQSVRVDVDHRFPRTSVLRFQTYVYNASRTGGAPDVWVQAKVRRGNQSVAETAPNKIPPDVSNDPASLPYWTEIALNQLPAGRYTLEVIATDRAANSNASQTIAFSVD